MKRKILLSILSVFILLLTSLVLASCSSSSLANPRGMDIVDNNFVWNDVDGADGYIVYFNDDEGDRYYVTEPYLSMSESVIQKSLVNGDNELLIHSLIEMNVGLEQLK